MPTVNGKKYPYTPAGTAAANRARARANAGAGAGAGILAAGAVERKKKAAIKAAKEARKAAKNSTIKAANAMKKSSVKKVQARRRMKAGSGYLSQSPAVLQAKADGLKTIRVRWPDGKEKSYPVPRGKGKLTLAP